MRCLEDPTVHLMRLLDMQPLGNGLDVADSGHPSQASRLLGSSGQDQPDDPGTTRSADLFVHSFLITNQKTDSTWSLDHG